MTRLLIDVADNGCYLFIFFFFHVEYDNSSEGDADNGGRNVDTADDDIDDFIDNAVAIVVLLAMSRMKVIG